MAWDTSGVRSSGAGAVVDDLLRQHLERSVLDAVVRHRGDTARADRSDADEPLVARAVRPERVEHRHEL